MKAVKITGIIVVAIAAIVVVLGMIAPTKVHVERTVAIEAPKDFIWGHVSTLAAMEKWSPWRELDPEQVVNYEGADGTVGAVYHWSGNDQVGEGKQIITGIDEGNRVDIDLEFIRPFESTADVYVALAESEGATSVTWAYDGESSFPMNIMNLFMDMDDLLGPDFEKGMNMLKQQAEAAKATRNVFDGFTIQTTELEPRTYVGVHSTVKWADMQTFFGNSYSQIQKAAAKAKAEPQGAPVGVYFNWDEANQQADMMAAFPMAADVKLEGLEAATVGGKALTLDYYGDYAGSEKAHMAIDQYIKWHGLEQSGPVVEEYVTDPMSEADTSKWLTRIYYPVK